MSEKHIILGLIELKERRQLASDSAQTKWIIEALMVLLKSELDRIEASEIVLKEPANDAS